MKFFKKIRFVLTIIWLTLKINFYFLFNGNKKLGALILKYKIDHQEIPDGNYHIQKINRINQKVDWIINFLPLKKSCLIRSMVKKEYHKINNIFINIFIGVKKEGEKILTHAWVNPVSINGESFKILHII